MHGQKDIAMLTKRLAACTRLSTTVSQLFEPQLQKITILRTPAFIFCLPWGRPCGNHAKRCMNEKTIQCLPNPSQHVPIYLKQFHSYSNHKCKQEAQLLLTNQQSLTNRAMLVCKVVEVWQDFLSEYVDKKFTYICYRRLIRHE